MFCRVDFRHECLVCPTYECASPLQKADAAFARAQINWTFACRELLLSFGLKKEGVPHCQKIQVGGTPKIGDTIALIGVCHKFHVALGM